MRSNKKYYQEYRRLYEKQEGRCEICGRKAALGIYYNEKYNEVCALICSDCDWILKHFNYKLQPFKNFLSFIRYNVIQWGDIEDETEND